MCINILDFVNTSIEEDDDLNLASKSIEDREEVIKCFKKHRNNEFLPEQWSTCTLEHVAALPADIDGLVKYITTCDINDMMKCTKDGRPWGRWVTSSRIGFNGKRRLARCKGSPVCNSETCPFRSKYGVKNRTQFQKKSSVLCCFTCGTVADWPECPAV
ncbi:unnamed protein product [Mytilus coruscus]|uniref:Uncharacterized protein n=1 Tax=Mytilus coruscus TaxID=42192 RepID=A0A6J8DFU3_MYTCO|nr:unnamed protein product [Mytilus coruscus]